MLIVLERKVFPDTGTGATVTVGDGAFQWPITKDLDGTYLIEADAGVSTVSSSGAVTVQLRNKTRSVDMLSTKITIDSGEFTSFTATTPSVVDDTGSPPRSFVSAGDVIAVDVDVAGTGAMGLSVILVMGGKLIPQ